MTQRTADEVRAEIENWQSFRWNYLISQRQYMSRLKRLIAELTQLERNDNERVG